MVGADLANVARHRVGAARLVARHADRAARAGRRLRSRSRCSPSSTARTSVRCRCSSAATGSARPTPRSGASAGSSTSPSRPPSAWRSRSSTPRTCWPSTRSPSSRPRLRSGPSGAPCRCRASGRRSPAGRSARVLADIGEGLRFLWRHDGVRSNTVIGMLQSVAGAGFMALCGAVGRPAARHRDVGLAFGLVFSVWGVGGILASALTPWLLRRFTAARLTLLWHPAVGRGRRAASPCRRTGWPRPCSWSCGAWPTRSSSSTR